jgi:hypothetical protein
MMNDLSELEEGASRVLVASHSEPYSSGLVAILVMMVFSICSCSSVNGGQAEKSSSFSKSSAGSRADDSSNGIMNVKIAKRFPGAAVLGEEEFLRVIVGRGFRYREVASGIVVERPREVYFADGRYQQVGLRATIHGNYTVKRDNILIECPKEFLGMSNDRIFFRHSNRLFTASASGEGSIYELLKD